MRFRTSPSYRTSTTTSPTLLIPLLLTIIHATAALSIPHLPTTHPISVRQSFTDLALPDCALPCFITSLTTDGCKSETDFRCHCTKGNMLAAAEDCLNKGCDDDDRNEAVKQVTRACGSTRGGSGGGGGNGDDGNGDDGTGGSSSRTADAPSSTAEQPYTPTSDPSSTRFEEPSSSVEPTPSVPSTADPNPTSPAANPTPAPAPPPSSTDPSTTSPSSSSSTTRDPTAMPTDTPLALLPTDRQLSTGAKAGISVSVTVFASAILVTVGLYIRRLKADLRAAQAAAGVPESVWRAHISTAAAPGPISRRRSWRGGSRRGSPDSPLSPVRESGEGGVLKKKRGHVLSVVVEGEEDDSASMERMVHEPVPGQKEGLVDPLEMDAEHAAIFEAPTSITPRTRSRERGRERGSSFGDGSRPSTGRISGERGRYML